MPSDYDFTLYSHQGGPNGWKARKEHYELYLFQVAIVLSELKLKYRTIFTDFQKGEHKKEDFLKICPSKSSVITINADSTRWTYPRACRSPKR